MRSPERWTLEVTAAPAARAEEAARKSGSLRTVPANQSPPPLATAVNLAE